VLKENEIKKHGEYRTRRLVLAYYRVWQASDRAAFDRWLSPRQAEAATTSGYAALNAVAGRPEAPYPTEVRDRVTRR
jgi:hypothetical protein